MAKRESPSSLLVELLHQISIGQIRASPRADEITPKIESYRERVGSEILTHNETLLALLAKELRNGIRRDRMAELILLLRNRGLKDDEISEGTIDFLLLDQEVLGKIHEKILG